MTRTLNCERCGASFSTESWKAKYCSDACRVDAHKRQPKGKRLKCPFCGNEFVRTWNRQSYCSTECRCRAQGRSFRVAAPSVPECKDGRGDAHALESCPTEQDGVPSWIASARWKLVESMWVAVMVEQFGHDRNRASLARALLNIRRRYRGQEPMLTHKNGRKSRQSDDNLCCATM